MRSMPQDGSFDSCKRFSQGEGQRTFADTSIRLEGLIMKTKRKSPEIVLRNGKPAAVILPINDYREMLERLEDAEDLKSLSEMRKTPLKYRRLEDFLKEQRSGV